jgi:hypothetical protein
MHCPSIVVLCALLCTTSVIAFQGQDSVDTRFNTPVSLPEDFHDFEEIPEDTTPETADSGEVGAAAGEAAAQDAPVGEAVGEVGAQDSSNILGVIGFQPTVFCPQKDVFDDKICPSEEKLRKQTEVLNRVFNPIGFKFELKKPTYVFGENATNTLFMNENFVFTKDGVRHLSANHKGGRQTMNVFMKAGNFKAQSPNLQGLTFLFPEMIVDNPSWADGIFLHSGVLPGMKPFAGQFDLGHTLVHEAGHWLGLRHIFTDTCDATDMNYGIADDTPAITESTLSCKKAIGSCGQEAPVSNFMGYTSDSCRSDFTPSQEKVMQFTFFTLRSSAESI